VADFIGESNWVDGEVQSVAGGEVTLQTPLGVLRSMPPPHGPALTPGARVQVGFRPEAVRIGPGSMNSFPTRIAHVSYLGEIEQYGLEYAPGQVLKAFEQNPLDIRKVGEALTVHVLSQDILILPAAC
jgi:ABC-type Fe3+/spermidine/putrescine transport system ATPase subunit